MPECDGNKLKDRCLEAIGVIHSSIKEIKTGKERGVRDWKFKDDQRVGTKEVTGKDNSERALSGSRLFGLSTSWRLGSTRVSRTR